MFAAFLLAGVVFFNSVVATPAVDDSTANSNVISSSKSVLSANDTILEIFYNCKCIAFYKCEESNRYLVAARAGVLKEPMKCSKKHLVCCPPHTTTDPGGMSEELTTTTIATSTIMTKEPTEITTQQETISPKHVDLYQIDNKCGIPKTQINVRILSDDAESETTIPGEVPWIVAIFQKKRNSDKYNYKCAGSLIHPKVVLTVNHYVLSAKSPSELKVVATGKETFQNLGNPANERNVSKIIKHPKYYGGGLYNDIALLILAEEFDYHKYLINSICLPSPNESFTGKKCLAVGWGTNPQLQALPLKKVDVPVVDHDKCQDLLRKTRLGVDFNLHSSFMCAGGEAGKDTCKGDGGGPLICLGDEYKYVQAGIISWGVDAESCGKEGQPGIYTDVSQFREWIDTTLKEDNIGNTN